MSTLSFHNGHFDDIFEMTNISGDIGSKKRSIRKAVGEIGLLAVMPVVMSIQVVRVVRRRMFIQKSLKRALAEFRNLEERDQMKLELKFVNFYNEVEEQSSPLIKVLEGSDNFLTRFFVNQLKAILVEIKATTDKLTSFVYPEQVDPASDPILFKELVDAYKGVDLSDWRNEIQDESNASLVKNG